MYFICWLYLLTFDFRITRVIKIKPSIPTYDQPPFQRKGSQKIDRPQYRPTFPRDQKQQQKGGSEAAFKELQEAYEVLSNPDKRRVSDLYK